MKQFITLVIVLRVINTTDYFINYLKWRGKLKFSFYIPFACDLFQVSIWTVKLAARLVKCLLLSHTSGKRTQSCCKDCVLTRHYTSFIYFMTLPTLRNNNSHTIATPWRNAPPPIPLYKSVHHSRYLRVEINYSR